MTVAYESPFVELNSLQEVVEELSFLEKAFDKRMWNKLFYYNKDNSGFMQTEIDSKTKARYWLDEIRTYAQDKTNFPVKYSVGMNLVGEEEHRLIE